MIRPGYLAALALGVLLWGGLCFAFIAVIDPYGVSPLQVSLKKINAFKPKRLDLDRVIKPYEVWRYQPRTIFLGTSRIQWGIDPSGLDGTEYAPAYNAAVPAASWSENRALLEQYLAVDGNLKYVFVELFLYSFLEGEVAIAPRGYRDIAAAAVSLQFSGSALADGAKSLYYNLTSAVRPPHVGRLGLQVQPDQADIRSNFVSQSYSMFVVGVHQKVKTLKLNRAAIETMEKMRQLCDRHGVKLVFLLTPAYPWDDYRIASLGYGDFVRDVYQQVSALPNVYSYAQRGGPLDEPLSDQMQYWIDPFHFSPALGSLMISAILGRDTSKASPDFMLPLDAKTAGRALEVREAGLQRWIARNPDFVETFETARVLMENGGKARGALDIPGKKLTVEGRTFSVVPGTGQVELGHREGGSLVVSGWAVDDEAARPVEALVATAGSAVVAKWLPATSRPDLRERYGRAHIPEGFSMKVPLAPDQAAGPGDIRIFALTRGGLAGQLPSWIPEVLSADIEIDEAAGGTVEGGKVSMGGRYYPIVQRVAGAVEGAERTAHGYLIRGWAADAMANRSVKAVIAVQGSSVIGKVIPIVDRPDIRAGIASGAKGIGFQMSITAGPKAAAPIRLFALMADDVAVQLAATLPESAGVPLEKMAFPSAK